jgi:hypothetical protein
MRENPGLFLEENTRGWQFSKLTAQLAPPPSPARTEEEKILLLVSFEGSVLSCQFSQLTTNLSCPSRGGEDPPTGEFVRQCTGHASSPS